MSLFEEVAESKTEDRKGRLARFIKFTRRETKELVKHCIQQPKELCYENLKALMKKRYGNSHLYTRNSEVATIKTRLMLLHTESFSVSKLNVKFKYQ